MPSTFLRGGRRGVFLKFNITSTLSPSNVTPSTGGRDLKLRERLKATGEGHTLKEYQGGPAPRHVFGSGRSEGAGKKKDEDPKNNSLGKTIEYISRTPRKTPRDRRT